MKTKRFMVFGSDDYEAQGGAGDYLESAETLKKAKDYINNKKSFDEYHVLDLNKDKIVFEYRTDEESI